MLPLEPRTLAATEIAATHPVRFSSVPGARALLVCADGEGLETWARLAAEAGRPVALVGVDSAGLQLVDRERYEIHADPRARAYLSEVDPPYFAAHMAYVVDVVLPWARRQAGFDLPRIAFGLSNGAAWAASAVARRPDLFAGAAAFSLGIPPRRLPRSGLPPHALVAGTLEEHFHRATTRYARKLERRGVPVRLRTPERGHDHAMWADEFAPALEWLLDRIA